jgi:glycerol-3-phosphate O-acyltransferase/dihydroxyacetone phosphate acyltransferase
MALGAMSENKDLDIKIVPVGLNYFHPHRFRSRAVVSYGPAITIKPELVEKYKEGGAAKREAIAELIDDGYERLKSVTINSPNYDTLMVTKITNG